MTMRYLVVPVLVFFLLGPFLKGLIRGGGRLVAVDYYQGIPQLLAALTTQVTAVLDLLTRLRGALPDPERNLVIDRMQSIMGLMALALAATFYVAIAQQKHDPESKGTGNACGLLAMQTDLVGLGILATTLLFLKGF